MDQVFFSHQGQQFVAEVSLADTGYGLENQVTIRTADGRFAAYYHEPMGVKGIIELFKADVDNGY
jgi:hypothetical protein